MSTSSDHTARRAGAYLRGARRHGRLLARVERRIAILAAIRFVAFAVGGACTFAAWYDQEPWVYGLPAAVGWLVFLVAVWLHRSPHAMAPRLQAHIALHTEAAARLRHDWGALSVDGAAYLDAARPYLSELQVFGRASLFQLLCRARLPAGRARLAEVLAGGLSAEVVPARQIAARELSRVVGLRHRLEAEGRVVEVDDAALDRFLGWAEGPSRVKRIRPWLWLARGLVPTTWVLVLVAVVMDVDTGWRLPFLAQILIFFGTSKMLSGEYLPLIGDGRHRPFMALRRMFSAVEGRRFKAPLLKEIQANLTPGDSRPSVRMARLASILESLSVRHSALLYAVVNCACLWEVFQVARLARWKAAFGGRLRADVSALADLEALCSVAGFAYDHPGYGWPELSAAGPALSGRALAYPLFPDTTRKANDFELAEGGTLVLVTGSNMSGKSSFLRALGANVLLAQAGAPVCGTSLAMRPCRLSTSIQVTDAPEQGLSRFYAEVKRIAGILNDVAASEADPALRPRLYLVDEMLSGTNSRERHLASEEIVKRLVGATRSYGLVTTHDLSLVGVADALAIELPCYHFSDRFDGDALHFDYALREGVATTTNALHVLAMEGIEVPGHRAGSEHGA